MECYLQAFKISRLLQYTELNHVQNKGGQRRGGGEKIPYVSGYLEVDLFFFGTRLVWPH